MLRLQVLPLTIALATLATAASAPRNQVPDAVPDGAPRECLPLTQVRDSHVRSDQVIDFVTNGGKVYRNTLDQPCPELGSEQRYEHKTVLNNICASDTITVLLNQGPGLMHGATCGLGQFQPVKLVKH
jgi:hypothetical protein